MNSVLLRSARRLVGLGGLLAVAPFLLGFPRPVCAATGEVPGRIVLELSHDAATRLRAGTLDLPLPVNAQGLSPRLESLVPIRSGPLSRLAVLTFDSRSMEQSREWLAAVTAAPEVVRAAHDQWASVSALPDDPNFKDLNQRQNQLYRPGGLSLEATRAWPFVPPDREVVVAVIDTGVLWTYSELGGLNAPDDGVIWRNEAERNGVEGVDDDQNGFVDDFIGWDWVDWPTVQDSLPDAPSAAAPAVGEDGTVPDNDPIDFGGAGHGTSVAGIIAAVTDNQVGIAAAAPNARIMPLRAGWKSTGSGQIVFMSFCAQAIVYAAENGAQVINCSWDSSDDFGLGLALDFAINEHDVVVVGSAGNSGTQDTGAQYLASRDDVLGVGGINSDGRKASGSNYGTWVDIMGFYSGYATTRVTSGGSIGSPGSGTSFAAPQIAAQAAMLRGMDPTLDAAGVRALIRNTGQDIDAQNPGSEALIGGGLADYAAAARSLSGGWERTAVGHGLTPLVGVNDRPTGEVGFLGDATIGVWSGITGVDVAAWAGGVATEGTPSAWPGVQAGQDVETFLFWHEPGTLRRASSAAPADRLSWSVTAPTGPSVAVTELGESQATVYVPQTVGVQSIADAGTGVVDHDWPWVSLAAGPVTGTGINLVGLRADGVIEVLGCGPSPCWTSAPGPAELPPVIAEFNGPGDAVTLVVGGVPGSSTTDQRMRLFDAAGETLADVMWMGPPVTAASMAGFAGSATVRGVLVDTEGTLRLVDRDGSVQSVNLGGPVAGEVLCADLNGDWQTELIVLRADGTLLAWDESLAPLAGFPRRFPAAFTASPAIVDADGVRRVQAVDVEGTVWSLPFGPADRPAPWPTERGNPARTGFLDHDRATPVEAEMTLAWTGTAAGGTLCWSGDAARDAARLRVSARPSGARLWEGSGLAECVTVTPPAQDQTLVLERLERQGGWTLLGTAALHPGARLAAGHPAPNPSSAQTRISWSGAVGAVAVEVVDLGGRRVTGHRVMAASGTYRWDGRDDAGREVAEGVYFIRLRDDAGSQQVRKVVRLRR